MSTYSKNSIAQRDFYQYYKDLQTRKGKKVEDYILYSNILKDANLLLRDAIILKGEKVHCPYRMGDLFIQKYENTFNIDNKRKWKIDWKRTKEEGHVVYFESKYGYKWKWDKRQAIFKGKKLYTFKACRKASRLVSDAINNKHLDYFQ